MSIKDFAEGLATLRPYFAKPDGYHLGAEHDVIYVYATDSPVSVDDIAKLGALGWTQEYVELPEDKDWGPEYYDPQQGWAAFV